MPDLATETVVPPGDELPSTADPQTSVSAAAAVDPAAPVIPSPGFDVAGIAGGAGKRRDDLLAAIGGWQGEIAALRGKIRAARDEIDTVDRIARAAAGPSRGPRKPK
jgi:hypothetical protein